MNSTGCSFSGSLSLTWSACGIVGLSVGVLLDLALPLFSSVFFVLLSFSVFRSLSAPLAFVAHLLKKSRPVVVMVEAFFDAFCLDDQWNQIANDTNSSSGDLFGEKAFAFGDYTPCVADGGILSICYLLFVIFASVRLGQLCNRSTRKGRVLNKGRQFYRFFLVLFIWFIFLFQLLKDEIFAQEGGGNETALTRALAHGAGAVGAAAAPVYSTVGDLYMLQPMAPFQFFSRALSVLGWGLALIVAAVETSIFTPAGNWMMTFLGLMDLLCQFVKLYVVCARCRILGMLGLLSDLYCLTCCIQLRRY